MQENSIIGWFPVFGAKMGFVRLFISFQKLIRKTRYRRTILDN